MYKEKFWDAFNSGLGLLDFSIAGILPLNCIEIALLSLPHPIDIGATKKAAMAIDEALNEYAAQHIKKFWAGKNKRKQTSASVKIEEIAKLRRDTISAHILSNLFETTKKGGDTSPKKKTTQPWL